MPDLVFDLRFLRYAILVAEHGSIRRTAEILNLPQSTVSRRIQLLERRIGIPLFERCRTGARLTQAGERFIQDAAIGAGHLHQAIDALALAKRGGFGELRIGVMASLAGGFLAELLATFHRRYPAIEMKFEESTSQLNASAVLNGRLDAAFIPGERPIPGCRMERLWEEQIYVAVPQSRERATPEPIAWDDVRDETFLVTADVAGPEIEDYLIRRLSGPGFRPKISVQRVGRENLLNMVAHGFGITLTTESTLGNAYSGIDFQPIVGSEDGVTSSIVWLASNKNPALKILVDMSLAHVRPRLNAASTTRADRR